VLIVSPAHPLATKPSTTFAQALDYDFIGLGAGAHSHRKYARAAKRLDKTLNVRIHVKNIEDLCGLVSDNVGVAVVNEAMAEKYAHEMGFVAVDLEDGWARRQTSLCIRTPRTLPKFAYDLLDVILETADDLEKKAESLPAT